MDHFALLLERRPLVFAHLVLAVTALLLGIWMLRSRKGSPLHRQIGWVWVIAMGGAALSSAFIRDHGMPNIAGFTPIHVLTVVVLALLPLSIWHARHGRVQAHRRLMQRMYIGGCLVAGAFTLVPGRFLGNLLWKQTLGLLA